MSRLRRRADSGFADRSKLPRGPKGNVLCRWCKKETDSPRKNFCGPPCVHEWKLRSSPSYARSCVRRRDKGVCAICKVDTYRISKGLRSPLKGESVSAWKTRAAATRKKYGISGARVTFWDMDHTTPVVKGGGECGLEGLRTLCVPCHKECTIALNAELRCRKKA